MRAHRFYVGNHPEELTHSPLIREARLLHQWGKVLRFKPGQQIILFDGKGTERLYKLVAISTKEALLELITSLESARPAQEVYLAWGLLKNDNNDLVLQKCTEAGVGHFLPLITERCAKTSLNMERAHKIVVEASEQCGRGTVPTIYEPQNIPSLLKKYQGQLPIYLCQQGSVALKVVPDRALLCIGPEGGWTEEEQTLFTEYGALSLGLGQFTYRAETAAIVATSKLLQ